MFQLIWINFVSTLSLPHPFETSSIEVYSYQLVMLEWLSVSCHCKTYCWKFSYVTQKFRKQFSAFSIACNKRPPFLLLSFRDISRSASGRQILIYFSLSRTIYCLLVLIISHWVILGSAPMGDFLLSSVHSIRKTINEMFRTFTMPSNLALYIMVCSI